MIDMAPAFCRVCRRGTLQVREQRPRKLSGGAVSSCWRGALSRCCAAVDQRRDDPVVGARGIDVSWHRALDAAARS